jgi:glycosyltransferase involved in cell wall biosynthesis
MSERNHPTKLVIIGWDVAEVDSEGNYFVRKSIADYLNEISQEFDELHWFSKFVLTENPSYTGTLDLERIKVHRLRRPLAKNWFRKVIAWINDTINIIQCSKSAYGVIESFPAGGGISLIISLFSRRHVIYFGADPRKRFTTKRRKSSLNYSKRIFFLLSGIIAENIGSFVLVRDPHQFARLKTSRPKHVYLSKPVTSMINRGDFDNLDKCKDNEIILLFVGKLSQNKGLEDALQALFLLNSKYQDNITRIFRLVIVGSYAVHDDSLPPGRVEEISEELGIDSFIYLTGQIDDIEELEAWYRKSDVFVFPTWLEGFPRVLDEAASFGLPIVTTNIDEIQSVLQHGEQALLVEPRNSDELARAIYQIVSDSSIRKKLINGALKWSKERNSITAAHQHIQILKRTEKKHQKNDLFLCV